MPWEHLLVSDEAMAVYAERRKTRYLQQIKGKWNRLRNLTPEEKKSLRREQTLGRITEKVGGILIIIIFAVFFLYSIYLSEKRNNTSNQTPMNRFSLVK